jgi:hypothetical protein
MVTLFRILPYTPKILYYSLFSRHILAVVHFNANLHRATKTKKADNAEQVKVTYPKFKNGEATIRNVKISQNFCKYYLQYVYRLQVHLLFICK